MGKVINMKDAEAAKREQVRRYLEDQVKDITGEDEAESLKDYANFRISVKLENLTIEEQFQILAYIEAMMGKSSPADQILNYVTNAMGSGRKDVIEKIDDMADRMFWTHLKKTEI